MAPVLSTNVVSLHTLSSTLDLEVTRVAMSYGQKDIYPDCQSLDYSTLSPWMSGKRGATSVHQAASLLTGLQGSPECMGLSFCFLVSALTLASSHDQPNRFWFPLVISERGICGPSDSENLLALNKSCHCTRLLWEKEE